MNLNLEVSKGSIWGSSVPCSDVTSINEDPIIRALRMLNKLSLQLAYQEQGRLGGDVSVDIRPNPNVEIASYSKNELLSANFTEDANGWVTEGSDRWTHRMQEDYKSMVHQYQIRLYTFTFDETRQLVSCKRHSYSSSGYV